jgi:hypothetical protein
MKTLAVVEGPILQQNNLIILLFLRCVVSIISSPTSPALPTTYFNFEAQLKHSNSALNMFDIHVSSIKNGGNKRSTKHGARLACRVACL